MINTNPPPVIIESISVDGVLQHAKTLRAPLPDSLVIPAGKESLEIRYTALNLSAPDKSRFRYRLDNHETKWTEWTGETRVAHYSKLPPGDYRFQVTACQRGRCLEPDRQHAGNSGRCRLFGAPGGS